MTFFDRCRVLFMLDRDVLQSEFPGPAVLTESEARDLLSAFMQEYPEVRRFAERRLDDLGVRNVRMPDLCRRSPFLPRGDVPASGMAISHFLLRNRPFFERMVMDDLVSEEVKPSVIEKLGAMEIRARDEQHAEEANRILFPRIEKSRDEIAAMYPTVQMADDMDFIGQGQREHQANLEALIEWLKLHSSPSHQITAERMLKEWNVGDMTHAALVQWFLDNWSPSHATTIERLTRNYIVTRRES